MQIQTRSTTRAEALSRLQVSTRSQARAAMAPPAFKFCSQAGESVGYKRPRQKMRKLNAPQTLDHKLSQKARAIKHNLDLKATPSMIKTTGVSSS